MNVSDYVNELPPSSRLGALTDFLKEEPLKSPVDMYQLSIDKILRYGTQENLNSSDFLGRLLMLGIVSSAEAYFRAILSSCIEICPVAQSKAAEKMIHLGGLLWHGQAGFSRSAFEHLAFTSKDELSKAFKQYLGIELDDKLFRGPLDQYEVVCQLRHGVVHSDGLLPGRNAVQIDIPRYNKPVRIIVRFEQIQDIAAVVNTLVMTLNREVFSSMCRRWAIDWRKRADWEPSAESRSFDLIWNIFHCSEDRKRRRGRTKITKPNCLVAVKNLYGIA